MLRHLAVGMVLAFLLALPASGQEWASKMFSATSHDFGTVARGAKTEYRFEVKNIYKEAVHIARVRSSCGCTQPSVENADLETYETGAIVAKFNTQRFLGHRSATLTVTIDKPYYAEVRLRVKGNIRGDVVVEPGAVNFDTISEGSPAERTIRVKYSGRRDWKIVDVRSANPHFEAEIRDTGKTRGQVYYDLLIRLKDDAPVGYLSDQVFLVTTDPSAGEIPVWVEGRVVSEIAASPSTLYLGDVRPGGEVTKKLVVRGKQPFKILGVNCPDDCFRFKSPDTSAPLHVVEVTFVGGEPGKIQETITIRTDRSRGHDVTITAYVNVVEAATTKSDAVTKVTR